MKTEKRSFPSELRSKSGKLCGYAAVFNSNSENLGFVERIAPGAFSNALRNSDPRALFNHNPDYVLGRKSAGTLKLKEDDKGLYIEIDPPDTTWANDIRKSIQRGDIAEMSFGFTVKEDIWDEGNQVRTITEIGELFDVSPVTFPAYQSTTIEARSKKMRAKKMKQNVSQLFEKVKAIKNRCNSENREPTVEECRMANNLLDQIDQIESKGFFDVDSSPSNPPAVSVDPIETVTRSSSFPARFKVNPSGDVDTFRTSKKGYELRQAGDTKNFDDLYGNGLNRYRWTDQETTYFQALFGGRTHPQLTKRSMVEGIGSSGGFLVPVEYSRNIHNVALEDEIVLPRAMVQPMAVSEINIPAMDIGDHSSNLFGGFIAYWKGEESTLTEADPKTREVSLKANKLTGFLKFSNELFSDMPGNAGDKQLIKICGKGLGFYRDQAFLTGTGAGQPQGLLNSNCKVSVSKESGQTAATIVYENIANMLARLYPGGFNKSIWICHISTIPQLLQLSITIGSAGSHVRVLNESNGKYTMLGRPVIFTEKTEALGTEGDIILTDLTQYVCGVREELRIDLSQHVFFQTDHGAARLISRIDGQSLWGEALTLKDGTTTVSPIVTLADRS